MRQKRNAILIVYKQWLKSFKYQKKSPAFYWDVASDHLIGC